MRRRLAPLLFGLLLLLTACGNYAVTPRTAAWTASELGSVFDLSELGNSLTIENDRLVLDGRVLPPELVAAMPHLTIGKDLNLLNLSPAALSALSPEAAHRLMYASPEQLREFMGRYGITMAMVHAAWRDDQQIDVAEIVAAAAELDRSGTATAVPNHGLSAGAALLRDLGLEGR